MIIYYIIGVVELSWVLDCDCWYDTEDDYDDEYVDYDNDVYDEYEYDDDDSDDSNVYDDIVTLYPEFFLSLHQPTIHSRYDYICETNRNSSRWAW